MSEINFSDKNWLKSYLTNVFKRYEEAKAQSTDGSFIKEIDDRLRNMFTEALTEDVKVKAIQ